MKTLLQDSDPPEVVSYDPSGDERTVTLRWPSGNIRGYNRADFATVDWQQQRLDAYADLLRSAHCIALRHGEGTAWDRFAASIAKLGIGSVTARTYRILPSDSEAAP